VLPTVSPNFRPIPILSTPDKGLSAGWISVIVVFTGLTILICFVFSCFVLGYLKKKWQLHNERALTENEDGASASVYASRVGGGQDDAAGPPLPPPRPRGGWRAPSTAAVPLPSMEDGVITNIPPIAAQFQPLQPAEQQQQDGGRLPLPSFKDQARPVAAPAAAALPTAPQQVDRNIAQVAYRVDANAPHYKDQCHNVPPFAAAMLPAEREADDVDDA